MSGGIGTAVHVPSFAARDGRRAVETRYVDGLPQIVAWDLATGQRRQATTAPLGVETAAIEPDGHGLWWFDAAPGGQGRWLRGPFEGGHPRPALDGVPAGRMHGLAFDPRSASPPSASGSRTARGTTSADRASAPAWWPRSPAMRQWWAWPPAAGCWPPGVPGRTGRGPAVVTGLRRPRDAIPGAAGDGDGGAVWALGFRPDLATARPELLLVLERAGRYTLAFWRQGEGIRTHGSGSALDFDTEITACWYGPGRTALVQQDRAGRSRLLRADLDRGTTTVLPHARGHDHRLLLRTRPHGPLPVEPRRRTAPATDLPPGKPGKPGKCGAPGTPERPDRTGRSTTASCARRPAERPDPGAASCGHAGRTGRSTALWPPRPAAGRATAPGRRSSSSTAGPTPTTGTPMTPWTEALVRAGFAVVRTNYRGSTGYGPRWRDDFGHRVGLAQLEDLAAVRGHLIDAGVSETGRTGLCGYSWAAI